MTNKNILHELGNIDPHWIEEAEPSAVGAPKETLSLSDIGGSRRRSVRFPKRLAVCAASLALVAIVLSAVGVGNVYAAIRGLFSFIPGVGIEAVDETYIVYTCEPRNGRIIEGSAQAELVRASYAKGSLSATILVNKGLLSEDIGIYVNGTPRPTGGEDLPHYSLAYSSKSSMLTFVLSLETLAETDLFEIEIAGFAERLSFTMKPCQTVEELSAIGPTVTQNGITVTVTAERMENDLVVWCYETRTESATKDQLLNFGLPSNAAFEVQRYLETANGKIMEKDTGWGLFGRSVYELAGEEQSATLHIPYLAMNREEKGKIRLELPAEYTTAKVDYAVKTSLGSIRIVETERLPAEGNGERDMVRLYLAFENKDENQRIYGMNYHTNAVYACHFDGRSGTMDSIELLVERGETEVELTFDGINYYLMGDYSFELDIGQ